MGTPVWDGLPSFMLCSPSHSITGVGIFIVHVPKSPAKVKASVWEEINLLSETNSPAYYYNKCKMLGGGWGNMKPELLMCTLFKKNVFFFSNKF